MKRNGFIATSILYSFFLVFISLFIALILNYVHNQLLISRINEKAQTKLSEINNTKISDLEVGDFVTIANDYTILTSEREHPLNSDAKWVVARIDTSGTQKHYYFVSDLTANKKSVRARLGTDTIAKVQPMTINVFNEINNTSNKIYNKSILYKNNTINFSIVNASTLANVRNNSNITEEIKDSIFDVDGEYAVYADSYAANGYTPGYYLLKKYNFTTYKSTQNLGASLLSSYCAATFDYASSKSSYTSNNTFGFLSYSNDANITNNGLNSGSYVDYCYYASPTAYTHNVSDYIVSMNENVSSDLITLTNSTAYAIRVSMDFTIDTSAAQYVAGGKGISTDPYIITDGSEQS